MKIVPPSLFGFRGSTGLVVGSEFSVPRAFQSIHSRIGLECFVGVGAPYRFRLIHCSLSFSGSCPAAVVVVIFFPCSFQIERLGSPEFRTDRHFEGSMYSLMDRGTFDSFFERSRLDDLRAPSQLALIDQRWFDSQSFDCEFHRLGSRPFSEFWSALLESRLEESVKLVYIEIGSDRRRIACPRGGSRLVLRLVLGSMSGRSQGIDLDSKSRSEELVAPGSFRLHRWFPLAQMVLFRSLSRIP